jgi:hypothetical protein
MIRLRILMSALILLLMGWLPIAEAQQISSSAVACNFIGRGYVNPMALQGTAVAYFTDIPGISRFAVQRHSQRKDSFFHLAP